MHPVFDRCPRPMGRALALVAGAALAMTVPFVAYANSVGVTVRTPGATAGPASTFAEITTDVTHWLGIGGSGGAVNASFSSTPYALCFTSSLVDHTQVVMNKLAGPTSSGTVGLVTATCPANTRLLGGGARITPASVGSLKPIASFSTFNDSAHGFGQCR